MKSKRNRGRSCELSVLNSIVNRLIDSFCIFARAPDKGGGIEGNSKIIFRISQLNIYCDPSLEPSHQDSSNEGSQYMFLMEKYG